ncbi:hypothetical protein HIMB100_00006150 [SAR116 cluster alpha proteobacterium HIMB100]|nr:hypothetical protein HIMB100_00006150 [SAR116 cluster alpha proteobacterium HIMB100]
MNDKRKENIPQGFLNIRDILLREHGWHDNIDDGYVVTTIEGSVVLLSNSWVNDIHFGRKLTTIKNVLKRGRKIYFSPEFLIKSDKPLFQLELEGEDLVKRAWSHEMATYCWPLSDLYEAVGTTLVIENYFVPDRAIYVRAHNGPFKGKEYKFPVFCLQLPDAVFLEPEKFPKLNTNRERLLHFFREIRSFVE